MDWNTLFTQTNQPSPEDYASFTSSPLWEEFAGYIGDTYGAKPEYAHSGCSGQPGWNVKYRKSGKALCTLYPMPGYFIALVVVGPKDRPQVDALAPEFGAYMSELYSRVEGHPTMGAWLMAEVKDETALRDVKRIIEVRVKPKK
jgi:hypothetical protein